MDDDWSPAVTPWRFLPGAGNVLTIVDHASNHVPDGIELGIDAALLNTHIAWDIGAASLAEALGYPAFLATVSRLVVDQNREAESLSVVPSLSDGIDIPGNHGSGADRVRQYWHPYHRALEQQIAHMSPALLVSLHSFTPVLSSHPDEVRPWEIGILYNQDVRAARLAIPLFERKGINVGDQLPYSGKLLNATMNRHGEAKGIPYVGIEVRQDLIGCAAGVAKWASILLPVIEKCVTQLQIDREAHRI